MRVYDVVMLPYKDKRFDEKVIATCKYRNLADQIIGLQGAKNHGYRVVERENGTKPILHKGSYSWLKK